MVLVGLRVIFSVEYLGQFLLHFAAHWVTFGGPSVRGWCYGINLTPVLGHQIVGFPFFKDPNKAPT